MTEKSTLKKSATLAAAGLVVAGALLAGCGESKAAPMDDAYAGNSGETQKSQEEQSQSQSNGSDSSERLRFQLVAQRPVHHHVRQEGHRQLQGRQLLDQRPVRPGRRGFHRRPSDHQGRQRRDRRISLGCPFTTISKGHQDDFAKAINGVVDGKPLKGLKVDKVAGASWTSDAFNKALESRPPRGVHSVVGRHLQFFQPREWAFSASRG